MLSKITALVSLVGALTGALIFYANAAYFPMDRGVKVEEKVATMEKSLDTKLDRILMLVENRRSQ